MRTVETKKLLFVCSRNKWRSRTAETIFRRQPGIDVRSAGTSEEAQVRVTEKLIEWADIILVMEKRHKQLLAQRFGAALQNKVTVVLEIPDNYE